MRKFAKVQVMDATRFMETHSTDAVKVMENDATHAVKVMLLQVRTSSLSTPLPTA